MKDLVSVSSGLLFIDDRMEPIVDKLPNFKDILDEIAYINRRLTRIEDIAEIFTSKQHAMMLSPDQLRYLKLEYRMLYEELQELETIYEQCFRERITIKNGM